MKRTPTRSGLSVAITTLLACQGAWAQQHDVPGGQRTEIVHQRADVVAGFQQHQSPAAAEILGGDTMHPVGQLTVGQGRLGGVHRRAGTETAQVSDEIAAERIHCGPGRAVTDPEALPRIADTAGESTG